MTNIPPNQVEPQQQKTSKKQNMKLLEKQDLERFPNHCLGLVHIRNKQGTSSFTTGCLINSQIVLTSASALLNSRQSFSSAESIQFCLDFSGDLTTSTRIKIEEVRISERYASTHRRMQVIDPDCNQYARLTLDLQHWDYAVLLLQSPAIRPTHPHYMTLSPGLKMKECQVSVWGYGALVEKKEKFYQHYITGTLELGQKQNSAFFDFDTLKEGLRGSPVCYVEHQNRPENIYVVGMLRESSIVKNKSTVIMISNEVAKQLEQLMLKMKQQGLNVKRLGSGNEKQSNFLSNLLIKQQQKVRQLQKKADEERQKNINLATQLQQRETEIAYAKKQKQEIIKQLQDLSKKLDEKQVYRQLKETQEYNTKLLQESKEKQDNFHKELKESQKTNIMLLKKIKTIVEKDKQGAFSFLYLIIQQASQNERDLSQEGLKRAEELKDSGRNFLLQKQWKQASQSFQNALELNPNDADTFKHLGTVFEELDDLKEAIKCYHKAIQLTKQEKKRVQIFQGGDNNYCCYVFGLIIILMLAWKYLL